MKIEENIFVEILDRNKKRFAHDLIFGSVIEAEIMITKEKVQEISIDAFMMQYKEFHYFLKCIGYDSILIQRDMQPNICTLQIKRGLDGYYHHLN